MKFFLVPVVALVLGRVLSGAPQQSVEKLSARMTSRQVQQGKSVTIQGEVFYQRNGNLLTRFSFPKELIILSNKLGETRIYDPKQNSVMRIQNALFSTQTTQLAYFLNGSTADMGLTSIGYVQDRAGNERNLYVTEWKLKQADKKALIQRVKVVYNGTSPIYMHYTDAAGKVLRKVYYSGYQTIGDRPFPTQTTEIVYDKGDSTVSRTSYTDFRVNQQASSQYFSFTIPANANVQQP